MRTDRYLLHREVGTVLVFLLTLKCTAMPGLEDAMRQGCSLACIFKLFDA
jgi:hypothetical protein